MATATQDQVSPLEAQTQIDSDAQGTPQISLGNPVPQQAPPAVLDPNTLWQQGANYLQQAAPYVQQQVQQSSGIADPAARQVAMNTYQSGLKKITMLLQKNAQDRQAAVDLQDAWVTKHPKLAALDSRWDATGLRPSRLLAKQRQITQLYDAKDDAAQKELQALHTSAVLAGGQPEEVTKILSDSAKNNKEFAQQWEDTTSQTKIRNAQAIAQGQLGRWYGTEADQLPTKDEQLNQHYLRSDENTAAGKITDAGTKIMQINQGAANNAARVAQGAANTRMKHIDELNKQNNLIEKHNNDEIRKTTETLSNGKLKYPGYQPHLVKKLILPPTGADETTNSMVPPPPPYEYGRQAVLPQFNSAMNTLSNNAAPPQPTSTKPGSPPPIPANAPGGSGQQNNAQPSTEASVMRGIGVPDEVIGKLPPELQYQAAQGVIAAMQAGKPSHEIRDALMRRLQSLQQTPPQGTQ